MSVRKRTWTTSVGERRTAWVLDYTQEGRRHLKTFERKADATAALAVITVAIGEGRHTPASRDITLAEAAKRWLASCEAAGLERSTVAAYEQHVTLHIDPFSIAGMKLAALTPPVIRDFEDRLRRGDPGAGRSPAMVKRVVGSIGAILADAQERGLVIRNVVRELRGNRRRGGERRAEKRAKGKLKVGTDIPSREEIKAIIGALQGRWRPFMLTAIFTGLRASELRGLRWADVDLAKRELHVRQRADRYKQIGKPKSASGERTVPFSSIVLSALREHKIASPPNAGDLVFANRAGGIHFHSDVVKQALWPVQLAAGVVVRAIGPDGKPRVDGHGKPVMVAKYSGLHALRHFYASWSINRAEDGGLGLPAKVVQERMGHSTISMTLDTYGHLFPRGDDAAQMDAAERSLLA